MCVEAILFLVGPPPVRMISAALQAQLYWLSEIILWRAEDVVWCGSWIYKPTESIHQTPAPGFTGFHAAHMHPHVPCHVLYSPCVCEQLSGGLKVTRSHNRLWLTEPGAFLQFVPTSLLNHLHYLTVFPQRELQLSVSLMKVCTGRNSQEISLSPLRKVQIPYLVRAKKNKTLMWRGRKLKYWQINTIN